MRIDPLSPQEYAQILAAVPGVVGRKNYAVVGGTQESSQNDYAAILEALWHLGCHASVLSRDARERRLWGPSAKRLEDEFAIIQWKRPKTRRICQMPMPREAATRLFQYFTRREKPYHRVHIHRIVKECAKAAGLEEVTPLLFRHTVAIRLFQYGGPSLAKESLGVGDKSLQNYTALSPSKRLEMAREALR